MNQGLAFTGCGSSIDALQEVGISAADLNKIKAAGWVPRQYLLKKLYLGYYGRIATVLGVQQATRKALTKVCSFHNLISFPIQILITPTFYLI